MVEKQDYPNVVKILMNPEKYGYTKCESCQGFGGDNRRADGVPHELCEDCGGDGVIKKKEVDNSVIYDESGFSSGAGIK